MSGDWHAANFEGHAPTAHLVDTDRWVPACTDQCIEPDGDGVLIHPERGAAAEQAERILAGRIYGPTDMETRR